MSRKLNIPTDRGQEFAGEFSRLKKGFQTLQEISLEIAKAAKLNESLQRIVDLVVDFMKVNRASIMLLEPDGYLRIKAFHGMPADIARTSCVKLGEQISGRVALEGRMIMSQDITSDPDWNRKPRDHYRSNAFMCIPMIVKENVIGVINVNDKIEHVEFDVFDKELITIVANQAAAVIENFKLYSDVKKSIDRLHRSNRRLSMSQKRMRTIIELIDDGVIATDSLGRVLLFNRNATDLFPGLRINRSVFRQMQSQDFGVWLKSRYKVVKSGGKFSDEFSLKYSDVKTTHFRIRTIPIHSNSLDQDYYLNLFTDITFQSTMELNKRHFIALVSHELRTPLTAIKAYLGPMMAGLLGDINEDMQDGLATISDAADRLQGEIDNLILMSRLYQDDEEPEMESFDLKEEIDKLVTTLGSEALQNGARIEKSFHTTHMCVIGNQKLIRVAIRNLLANAIKYSPDNGVVELTVSPITQDEPKRVRVTVTDTGPGISPAERDRIFEKFEQIESHLTRRFGGIGLGLSMTKRIIELHGSEIELQSHPGKGSCFSFTLKLTNGREQ